MATTPSPFFYQPINLGSSSAADGGKTRSQSALYGRISLNANKTSKQVGLAQRISWQGQTGNTPVRGIGEPYSENKPGDLYFTFTMSNFSIRTNRLLDMFAGLYSVSAQKYYGNNGNGQTGLSNIDFRQISFDVEMDFGYASPSLNPVYETSSEYLVGCWIQTWTAEWSDPNSLRLEGVTGWASGYDYITSGGNSWNSGSLANSPGVDLLGQ